MTIGNSCQRYMWIELRPIHSIIGNDTALLFITIGAIPNIIKNNNAAKLIILWFVRHHWRESRITTIYTMNTIYALFVLWGGVIY